MAPSKYKWIAIAALAASQATWADNGGNGPRGGGHRQPPPEAYSACDGKAENAKASFVSPRGDTVDGTCVKFGERLALRPSRPPPDLEGGAPQGGMDGGNGQRPGG